MLINWRSRIGIASLLSLVLTVAFGCKSGPPKGAMGPMGPMGPAEVAVIKVQPETLAMTTELPGRTNAYLTAEIRPQVNGIIQSRFFEEGSLVRQGQVLYKIDPAPYAATLAQAKATLNQAEANLPSLEAKANRYRDLVAIHAVGQQDYDDAVASLAQAKAAVAADKASVTSAQINLSYTPVRSPISGRIGKSSITVGGLVSSYQTTVLATVQQLEPVYVDVVQSNADLLRLRTRLANGQLNGGGEQARKVRLLLEDGSQYPLEGTLQFRDVTVDATTGSVNLRMKFANPKQILLPGMYVRAIVEEGVKKDAILLPQQAVIRDPKGTPYCWIVDGGGHIARRNLELDRAIGNRWLVGGGLKASDQVVIEGTDRVKDGVQVRAVPYTGDTGAVAATGGK